MFPHIPVFVSFDYENDRRYKWLLTAWHANPRFQFVFQDEASLGVNSENVGRVKAALTRKIQGATHTLVIVGRFANWPHPQRNLIGHRNWINFEIYQSKQMQKKLVGVKLDRSFESPEELLQASASWAMSFTESAVIKALEQA